MYPLSETMWRLEVDDGRSSLDNNGWDVDLLQIVGNWKQNLLKILDSCSKGMQMHALVNIVWKLTVNE